MSLVPTIDCRPLRPAMLEDFARVMRGTWGGGCWCMHPRLSARQIRELPGEGGESQRRRAALEKLAAQARAPGLIAYRDGEPVGWVAIAPREEFGRIDASKATPRVDDQPVWVIPCITVAKGARGEGVALAMIDAAVAFAAQHGAGIVEAYPREGGERTGDDNVFIGTEALFARAGFTTVRGPLENLPSNWTRRVTVRRAAGRD